ncbi:MAG: Holliday junction branch migration protein RuvA [Bacteroidales bacterium]|nr:Holliday junction branch migration protein RuvA [Bacteroidales bacterium]
MLDYIKGEVADLTPATVTIDCNGVGYLAHISLQTYSTLSDKKTAKIYIYESVRQDAFVLFGFINKHEREVFLQLISVSGVGPSTARVMLSSLSSKELEVAIVTEDVDILRSVKGIGIKTAQRIIVDLKDKIKLSDDHELPTSGKVAAPALELQAVSALVMLGFTQAKSQKVVAKMIKEQPDASVEAVIKESLKRL